MKMKLKNTIHFIKKELLNTPVNIVLTILMLIVVIKTGIWFINWAFINAVWTGETSAVAQPDGATWAFIIEKLRFFIFGFFPKEQIWRIPVTVILLTLTMIPYFMKRIRHKILVMGVQLILWPLIIAFFLSGGLGLEKISTNDWGGLSLTFILSAMGLLYSFPIGIIVALGRRSNLPIVKGFSVAYIEFFRGIPLITILFMSSVVVPFFLPEGVSIDKMVRVIVGMTIFQSAYLAEVIRGGLQSIPKGQYEAADSLGFKFGLQSYLIILPQVLKMTVSNIGGISISYIKDTTLVLIIGMFDLLGIVSPLASDSNWLGMEPEGLIFAGMVYWIICFSISRLTYKVEEKVNELPVTGAMK
jgi:general L-amino acid transport system permease protein